MRYCDCLLHHHLGRGNTQHLLVGIQAPGSGHRHFCKNISKTVLPFVVGRSKLVFFVRQILSSYIYFGTEGVDRGASCEFACQGSCAELSRPRYCPYKLQATLSSSANNTPIFFFFLERRYDRILHFFLQYAAGEPTPLPCSASRGGRGKAIFP